MKHQQQCRPCRMCNGGGATTSNAGHTTALVKHGGSGGESDGGGNSRKPPSKEKGSENQTERAIVTQHASDELSMTENVATIQISTQ